MNPRSPSVVVTGRRLLSTVTPSSVPFYDPDKLRSIPTLYYSHTESSTTERRRRILSNPPQLEGQTSLRKYTISPLKDISESLVLPGPWERTDLNLLRCIFAPATPGDCMTPKGCHTSERFEGRLRQTSPTDWRERRELNPQRTVKKT